MYYNAFWITGQPLGLLLFCHMLACASKPVARTGTDPALSFVAEVVLLSLAAQDFDDSGIGLAGGIIKFLKGPATSVNGQRILELEDSVAASGHIGHSLGHRVVEHIDVIGLAAITPLSGLLHDFHNCIIQQKKKPVN
jgi:hypothetical protein